MGLSFPFLPCLLLDFEGVPDSLLFWLSLLDFAWPFSRSTFIPISMTGASITPFLPFREFVLSFLPLFLKSEPSSLGAWKQLKQDPSILQKAAMAFSLAAYSLFNSLTLI